MIWPRSLHSTCGPEALSKAHSSRFWTHAWTTRTEHIDTNRLFGASESVIKAMFLVSEPGQCSQRVLPPEPSPRAVGFPWSSMFRLEELDMHPALRYQVQMQRTSACIYSILSSRRWFLESFGYPFNSMHRCFQAWRSRRPIALNCDQFSSFKGRGKAMRLWLHLLCRLVWSLSSNGLYKPWSTLSFAFNDKFLTSPKPFLYGKRILALIACEKLFFAHTRSMR